MFGVLAQGADNEYAMIDSAIVRVHQHSAGARKNGPQAIGRNRRGLSTKVHATIGVLGNPTGFHLTGQAHDLGGADVLPRNTTAETVIADRAYDALERLIEPLQRAGKQVVIPSSPTRKVQRAATGIFKRHGT